MQAISSKVTTNAMDYDQYRQLIEQLFLEKRTTNEENSETMLNYTSLNLARMKRLDRTIQLTPDSLTALQQLKHPLIWLVITEGWCGDAAQIIPVIQAMAHQNKNISLKLILRDQHPDVMDAFLTNGARAIPILLMLDATTLEVLATWGPRPLDAQAIMKAAKSEAENLPSEARETLLETAKIALHKWYTKNKGVQIQQEISIALQAVMQQLEKVKKRVITTHENG